MRGRLHHVPCPGQAPTQREREWVCELTCETRQASHSDPSAGREGKPAVGGCCFLLGPKQA